jgi:hypothetical protein
VADPVCIDYDPVCFRFPKKNCLLLHRPPPVTFVFDSHLDPFIHNSEVITYLF